MNIVVVSPDGGRDVLQPHLDKLLPALRRRGYTIEFVGWDRTRRWPRRSTLDEIEYTMVLRGGGYSSRRLLVWMPVWYVVATIALLRRPRRADEVVMAIDFEGAVPAAVGGRLRGHRFIYNCRDNISMRYRVPRAIRGFLDRLDALVMSSADAVIFPDESRVPAAAPAQTVIVRNCAPEVAITRRPNPSSFTVYASGNLRHDRGIGLLLDAAAEVDGCRVVAAGKCRDPKLMARLTSTPRVDYRGVLPPTEALELCGEADVVFTFYAPGPEINRKAVSNKWSDAMMAARPVLVNEEVEKSAWVQEQGIGYACRYDKDDLVRALRRLAGDRDDLAAHGARGRQLWEAGYRWDVMEERIVALLESVGAGGEHR